MKDHEKAKAILRAAECRIYNLMGPNYADLRQELMEALTGQKRPKATCGVTNLHDELVRVILPDAPRGTFVRLHQVREWCGI